jgi:hypothetical protein
VESTVTITAAGEREVSVSDDVATAASELVEDEDEEVTANLRSAAGRVGVSVGAAVAAGAAALSYALLA